MNFYYDPILGLQYDFIGFIEINIDLLPKSIHSLKEIMHLYHKQGVEIINTTEYKQSITPILNITTNKL